MTHQKDLVGLGLSEGEARLYLAGLGTGPVPVRELVRLTRMPRPTVYHTVRSLVTKGLASEQRTRGVLRVTMSPPLALEGFIAQQQRSLADRAKTLTHILPALTTLSRTGASTATVVQYSGIEGMKTVMDIAFRCRSKRWDVIAPYKNFLREYDADYAKQYLQARKYHGITSRTLWEDSMRSGRALTAEEKRERNPRLMPWTMHGKFTSMIILFDDKVAIFSSLQHETAMLITSPDIHALFQALFDGVWEFSESY